MKQLVKKTLWYEMAPFDVVMVPLFTLQIKRCIPDVAGVGLSQVTLSANIKRLQTYWNGITRFFSSVR